MKKFKPITDSMLVCIFKTDGDDLKTLKIQQTATIDTRIGNEVEAEYSARIRAAGHVYYASVFRMPDNNREMNWCATADSEDLFPLSVSLGTWGTLLARFRVKSDCKIIPELRPDCVDGKTLFGFSFTDSVITLDKCASENVFISYDYRENDDLPKTFALNRILLHDGNDEPFIVGITI